MPFNASAFLSSCIFSCYDLNLTRTIQAFPSVFLSFLSSCIFSCYDLNLTRTIQAFPSVFFPTFLTPTGLHALHKSQSLSICSITTLLQITNDDVAFTLQFISLSFQENLFGG